MQTFNLFNGETEGVPQGAPGDRGTAARVGSKLGASRLGMSVYDLPPDEVIGPYHFEWTDEEWLIVLAGEVAIRSPEGEQTLVLGDVVCFPVGPAGAHQVRSTSDGTARVAIVSTKNEFGIVEYPEDKKVGIWARDVHYSLDHPTA
jgi:uncharacterized cupin superfamily protein